MRKERFLFALLRHIDRLQLEFFGGELGKNTNEGVDFRCFEALSERLHSVTLVTEAEVSVISFI